MTQGVKDLINAIAEGDSETINASFNAEMATRISARLEDTRVQVAQTMFKTEQVEEEVEDEIDLTEEQIDDILESITEEDMVEIEEASYSAKAAHAGHDIGKPGKQFHKIADKAAHKYGSKEAGERVAGAILAKLRAKHGG
jgi:hypothetical protein